MQIGKEMAIPSILKIGNGALGKIGSYLKTEGLDQVVLFFGNGLIDMFGELVMNSLKEADVNVLEYNELVRWILTISLRWLSLFPTRQRR